MGRTQNLLRQSLEARLVSKVNDPPGRWFSEWQMPQSTMCTYELM